MPKLIIKSYIWNKDSKNSQRQQKYKSPKNKLNKIYGEPITKPQILSEKDKEASNKQRDMLCF